MYAHLLSRGTNSINMVFCLTSKHSKRRHFVSNFSTRNEPTIFSISVPPGNFMYDINTQNIHAFAWVVIASTVKRK